MYNCKGKIMNIDEFPLSEKLGFWDVVADKEIMDFFTDIVSGEVGAFHKSLLLMAESQGDSYAFNKIIENGLRTVANRLVPESRNCDELGSLLKAQIDAGKLEDSEKEKDNARRIFILTFIEDHKSR